MKMMAASIWLFWLLAVFIFLLMRSLVNSFLKEPMMTLLYLAKPARYPQRYAGRLSAWILTALDFLVKDRAI
jgi:hypothetical protein